MYNKLSLEMYRLTVTAEKCFSYVIIYQTQIGIEHICDNKHT